MTTTTSVLITFALQETYLSHSYCIKNHLSPFHVCQQERERLLGRADGPANGPLVSFLNWTKLQPQERLHVIHIVTQHNNESTGMILELDKQQENFVHHHHVTIPGINAFVGSNLEQILQTIIGPNKTVPIGMIGLWSDSTLSYLAYDLKTRHQYSNVATCSALSASSSRTLHLMALKQMKRTLDVPIFDSLTEFQTWLVPKSNSAVGHDMEFSYLDINCTDIELKQHEREMIKYLYRDSARVELQLLSGGFSDSRVFKVDAHDELNHKQSVTVFKIGSNKEIAKEKFNFERVEQVLGMNAPYIRGYVELENLAAIKFTYASMGDKTVTFQKKFTATKDQALINNTLSQVFENVMQRLYCNATKESIDLFKAYNFDGTGWRPKRGGTDTVSKVKERLCDINCATTGNESTLTFGKYEVKSVALFLEHKLEHIKKSPIAYDLHYMCYIHGDMNGRNILCDSHLNIWLIDFERTEQNHILQDILKLESDILYEYTNIESPEEYSEALDVVHSLSKVNDLNEPLALLRMGTLSSPKLLKTWNTIVHMRSILSKIVKEDRNPIQMFIPLLRYALQLLSFNHLSVYQRQLCAFAACLYAARIDDAYKKSINIRVDWFEQTLIPVPFRFGITLLPGRIDRKADMNTDLTHLSQQGVKHLVCLCNEEEMERACSQSLVECAVNANIAVEVIPIPQSGTPTSLEDARTMVRQLHKLLQDGNTVLCSIAGLGRCGLIAALLLLQFGTLEDRSVENIMNWVRQTRSSRVFEDFKQVQFIREYATAVKKSVSVSSCFGSPDMSPKLSYKWAQQQATQQQMLCASPQQDDVAYSLTFYD